MQRLWMRGIALVFVLILVSLAWAGDAVPFSGEVKKVQAEKGKVGIMNPETKKRFTVVIGEDSTLEGFSGIDEIKKGDRVSGAYVVTDAGLYVVTKMKKE